MSDFTDGIKKLAMSALENSQPSDVCFGTVSAVNPLAVRIEDLKMTLGAALVVVPDYLKDWSMPVTVDGKSGTGVLPWGLKPGDRVILLKKAGGQKYVILGREG